MQIAEAHAPDHAPDKITPTYAAAFRCIGAACEDHCCANWDIPVDKITYAKYQTFPPQKLGSLVQQFVIADPEPAPAALHAHILRPPSGCCPFFDSDRLCAIQKEYGQPLLPSTCSLYPRSLSHVDEALEGSLSLSCPEAARNVLLSPDFIHLQGNLLSGDFRTDNVFALATGANGSFHKKPHRHFHAIRSLTIHMIRDRQRPLWQRLLLIGSLCKRLAESNEEAVPALLADYRQILESGDLHAEMKSLPSAPKIRLEVILGLTSERIADSQTCGKRFIDTFWTFVEGIGSATGSAPADAPANDIARFLHAEQTYHHPFFEASPFILENYLLNYIFQNLFPFGRAGSDQFIPRSIFDEWLLMTTQFAWVNGLLVGIAAHDKESFSQEQVIRTIQSYTRAVEHYPDVLNSTMEYIAARGLNSLQGMAILLRDQP